MWIVALWTRRAVCVLADGDVITEISLDTVDFLDRTQKSKSTHTGTTLERDPECWSHTTGQGSTNSRRCCSVKAARSLFWIGSCSKFWTDRGTSNVSSAATASAVWQRSAFHERGGCTVRMTSLGKHPHGTCFYRLFILFKRRQKIILWPKCIYTDKLKKKRTLQ